MKKITNFDELLETMDNIFRNILPKYGYNIRENQIELSKQMLEVLYYRKISISEAGVGIGKTHAYIIASLLVMRSCKNDFWLRTTYKLDKDFQSDTLMPMIISTSSIALQKAITTNYIPEISKILLENKVIDHPISSVIRKGKEHYICDNRLEKYIKSIEHREYEHKILLDIEKEKYIDMDIMSDLTLYLKEKINVPKTCNSKCKKYDDCRYVRFMKNINSSTHDFQVCNHNYLIADLSKRNWNSKALIPNYQGIIIDEAHKLVGAYEQMHKISFSKNEIEEIVNLLDKIIFKTNKIHNLVQNRKEKLLSANKNLFKILISGATNGKDGENERIKTKIGIRAIKEITTIIKTLNYFIF